MTRYALLASALLLSSCSGSGFWAYEHNTLTLPGANPNMPTGSSENYLRARARMMAEPEPLVTEAGDIWPGPTQNVPTLKDLQKQQSAETGQGGTTGPGLAPLPPLPSLPGYEISQQDVVSPIPTQAFPHAVVPTNGGSKVQIRGDQGYKPDAGTSTSGNIVVPNGNGTSTVISPTGQVSTIPTPK